MMAQEAIAIDRMKNTPTMKDVILNIKRLKEQFDVCLFTFCDKNQAMAIMDEESDTKTIETVFQEHIS